MTNPRIEKVINRLEQLGILEDKNVWLELRKTRNTIAHQYEDEPQQATETLNAIYIAKPTLEKYTSHLKQALNYAVYKYDFKRLYKTIMYRGFIVGMALAAIISAQESVRNAQTT